MYWENKIILEQQDHVDKGTDGCPPIIFGQINYSDEQINEIMKDWILLDSQSTVHVIRDKNLLYNIRPAKIWLKMITNAGSVMVKQEGIFPGLGKVWYYPQSISNI